MRKGTIASLIVVLIVTCIATVVRLATTGDNIAGSVAGWIVYGGLIAAATGAALIPFGIALDRAIGRFHRRIALLTDERSQNPVNTSMSMMDRALDPLFGTAASAVERSRQRELSVKAQLVELEIRYRVSEAQRRQNEAVLGALKDAVLVTDAFDEIVIANQAAAEALGFELKAALQRPIADVIGDERLRQLIRESRNTADFANARHVELDLSNATAPGVFEATLACVENHKHEVGGVVTILHDLSREREVSQMKTDFVSKASHELRTPLSSIRAYIEMLVDGEVGGAGDEASRQEFYRIIQAETDRLGRLIDNMLNISRIEAGIVQVQRDRVDMKAVAMRATSTIQPQALEKNIAVHCKLPDIDLCVEGDGDMLYQVMLNLLSNSVKYTPAGGSVTVAADGEGVGVRHMSIGTSAKGTVPGSSVPSVIVSVTDTGLGVPAESLPKLFEKFYRIENYKRVAKGTGLGLNLCKHIVETMHHGQIGVESKVGTGSKFWFSIPMRYAGKKAA